MTIRNIKASELMPDPSNANRGTERGRALLEQSLRTYGAGRSILVDKHGRIIAGNKTLETAAEIGLDDVVVVQTDGRQVVAVQRMDLDLAQDEEARMMAYADNRVGQIDLDFDPEQLLADINAGFPLTDLWRQDELDALMAELMPPATTGDTEPQIDKAAELQAKWQTSMGQLWEMGQHRLIVGDCTDRATVERVMGGERAEVVVTDPPYGIMALGGRRQTHEAKGIELIENDDLVGDALVEFLKKFIRLCPIKDESSFYICYGWKSQAEFTNALRDSGLTLRATITWVKNIFGLSAKNNVGYRPQTEFVYFATKSKEYNWKWNGGGTQSDAWLIDRPTEREGNHPTNKPLELPTKCIENSSDSGDLIYDPFAGSGTTGIACHNLGRKARMIEIAPNYAAVILQRMADHTNATPRLVT